MNRFMSRPAAVRDRFRPYRFRYGPGAKPMKEPFKRLIAAIPVIAALVLVPAVAAAQSAPSHPSQQFSAAKKKASAAHKRAVRKAKTKKDPGYLRIP
jgi:hypothetical protein